MFSSSVNHTTIIDFGTGTNLFDIFVNCCGEGRPCLTLLSIHVVVNRALVVRLEIGSTIVGTEC